jgi:predicted AAA+ superfamily ATPase
MSDKNIIKNVILENQTRIVAANVVNRKFNIEENGNYVFTGSRRAGKTYAMFQIAQEFLAAGNDVSRILYINFEDERLLELTYKDFDVIVNAYRELFDGPPVFFLDEIQIVFGWEKFVRRLADAGFRVYVTGSNAQMLSRDIATVLGGRFITKEIYPFSFPEYLAASQISLEKNWEHTAQRFDIKKHFDAYFHTGGYPEALMFRDKRDWLENLYQNIFYGDLILRYNIRNDYALKLLVKKLAESVQSSISFNRIRNIIQSTGQKIGTSTVIDYVSYLQESYLIFSAENFLAKISERETSKKYYFIDNGLLSLFLANPEVRLLENIVACTLKRQGKPVFFAMDKAEVDFYLPDEETAIQVCYSIDDIETREREVSSLLKIGKALGAKQYKIFTFDDEREISDGDINISVVPVWKWLLWN